MCLTQNQGLLLPIFPFVSACKGVIDALEEVAGCQSNFLIVNSHDAAHPIHTHHVNNSHSLNKGRVGNKYGDFVMRNNILNELRVISD